MESIYQPTSTQTKQYVYQTILIMHVTHTASVFDVVNSQHNRVREFRYGPPDKSLTVLLLLF